MNGIFEQLAKIWSELTGGQKLTIIVALLAVVVGMGALVYWSSKPEMRLLYGGIDAKEMSQVVTALDEEKVPYEMGAGGRSVFVPAAKVYQLRMKMASQGIPSGGGVGYEIFDKGNFGISDFVQRTNYIRALQGELARSIGQLDGVRSARVMIVLPDNKLVVTNENSRPTASVFVDVGGRQLGEENVNAIRYLVANSVEALKVNDVAVIDSSGKVLSSQEASDSSAGVASSQLKMRKSVEDYFTQKIHTMLTPVLGEGNVVVRVSADLNFDAQTLVEEKYDPEGQVIRSQTLQEDTANSTEASAQGGAVGVAGNTPGASGAASSGQNTNSNSKKNRSTAYEINKSVSETVKNPGNIKSVSAAVFIARKSDAGATTSAPVNRTPQEIDNIKRMVVNALGLQPGDAAEQRISIQEMTFEKPAVVAEKKGLAEVTSGVNWMETGRQLITVVAALGIFMVFLNLLKKQKGEAAKMEVMEEKTAAAAQAPVALTPEILNGLIQQKPENVSAALKTWVSAGATKR